MIKSKPSAGTCPQTEQVLRCRCEMVADETQSHSQASAMWQCCLEPSCWPRLTHTNNWQVSYVQFAAAGWVRFNVLPNTLSVISGTGFYWSNDPTKSVEALKEDRYKGLGFNPIRSIPLCYYNMTYTQKKDGIQPHKHKTPMHSEMGPVWQNPIQRTVRTAHLSVLMTVHNFSTQYNTERFW